MHIDEIDHMHHRDHFDQEHQSDRSRQSRSSKPIEQSKESQKFNKKRKRGIEREELVKNHNSGKLTFAFGKQQDDGIVQKDSIRIDGLYMSYILNSECSMR